MKATIFLLLAILLCNCVGRNPRYEKNDKIDKTITIWYGDTLTFGKIGRPQRDINVLGNISSKDSIMHAVYILNQRDTFPFDLGQNSTRLARKGDFNFDIPYKNTKEGRNNLEILAVTVTRDTLTKKSTIIVLPHKKWPLPYKINWQEVSKIEDAVQVVDGKWKITPEGIRTVEPYYDRVLAFGDSTWQEYEISTTVIFHDYASPKPGPPTYNVSHAALAFRWPGHEEDGIQPKTKWYPLGATCEFKLTDNLDSCRFRIIGSPKQINELANKHHTISMNKKYNIKARALTLKNQSLYQAKLWSYGDAEPNAWDIELYKDTTDLQKGAGLLLSHNTDVTFGNVTVDFVKN